MDATSESDIETAGAELWADPAARSAESVANGASVAKAVVPVEPGELAPLDEAEVTSASALAPAMPWDALDDAPLPPRRPRLVTPVTWVLFGLLLAVGGFAAGAKVGRDRAPATTVNVGGLGGNAARAGTGAAAGNGAVGAAGQGGTSQVGTSQGGGGQGRTQGAGQQGAQAGQGAGAGGVAGGPGGAAGNPTAIGAGANAAGANAAGANGAGANGPGGFGGAAAFGQVKLIDGNNVYIQDNQGNVIKVTAAAGTPVNVAKVGSVTDLKPGDTIIVQGTADADGNVAATSISSAGAGGFGGRGQRTGQGTAAPGGTAQGANGQGSQNG